MEYRLQLVEEKVKRHQVTALHLTCGLAFLGGGAVIFAYNSVITQWGLALLLFGLALMSLTIFKNKVVTAPKSNTILRVLELLVSAALCIYSATQRWNFPIGIYGILSAGIAYAMFWERSAGGKQFILINEDGIKLPIDSRKRFIQWPEVEKVIFRFGTLSVNCADNRMFQWNMHNPDFDMAVFESWCDQQVEANKSKRLVDDW